MGHDIRTEGPSIRQRIGYMPEYEALDPRMDGIHQVRYAGELLGMNPVVAMQRAHQCLEYVGLGGSAIAELTGIPRACGRPPNSRAPSSMIQRRDHRRRTVERSRRCRT